MTTARRQPSHELTLVGKLGPVLRAMAERSGTVSCEPHEVTIMRVRARPDEDLLDVVLRLRRRGLEVTGISAIPRGE